MNNRKIEISVTGGNAVFGDIVQGDNNRFSLVDYADDLQEFYSAISDLKLSHGIAESQIDALKKEIESLGETHRAEDIPATVRGIYDQYSWALEPLKKLFSVFFPE